MSEPTASVVPVSRPPHLFGAQGNPLTQQEQAYQDAWNQEDVCDRIGLPAIIPNGTSSDYESVLSNPFQFFLTRRLGLAPFWVDRACLVHGSWFHTALELDNFASPEIQVLGYQERLATRLKELQDRGVLAGRSTDMLVKFYDEERRMAQEALVWYETSCMVPIPNFLYPNSTARTTTWRNILRLPRFRILAKESRFTVPIKLRDGRDFTFSFQPDLLTYDSLTNSIWPWDHKTTALAPSVRATAITYETQTLFYMDFLQQLLDSGFLQAAYGLPVDCTLGPMVHVIMQKPTIKMCAKDRAFKLVDFTPKTGKNKGITRQQREFYGEPLHNLYLKRCKDWMLGRGEYAHEDQERASEPTVNISLVRPSILRDPAKRRQIEMRMELIANYATCPPIPSLFLQSGIASDSPYEPFHRASPLDWPLIAAERGLIVTHRNV